MNRSLLEVAWGADLTADPGTWTYEPIDDDRFLSDSVTITRGRQDESGAPSPASASFLLDNGSGDYTATDRRSPLYPNVRRGTPIRFSILVGAVWEVRFVGQIVDFSYAWPQGSAGDEARVTVSAAGILRRLGQGGAVNRSALWREYQPTAFAYWPLEGDTAAALVSPTPDVAPLTGLGFEYGSADTLPGSRSVAQGPLSAIVTGAVPTMAENYWTAHILASSPGIRLTVRVAGAAAFARVEVLAGTLTLSAGDGAAAPVAFTVPDGWVRVVLSYRDDVSDLRARVIPAGGDLADYIATVDYGPLAGTSGKPTSVSVEVLDPEADVGIGHLVVAEGTILLAGTDVSYAWDGRPDLGWLGETAAARAVRFCAAAAVDLEVIGDVDGSTPMGSQPVEGDLLAVLAECAIAEQGILGEQVDRPGLTFRTAAGRQNLTPAITLDASDASDGFGEPFEPVFDDQALANEVLVTVAGASVGYAADEASIEAEGLYSEGVDANLEDALDADVLARWRLHIGTWPELRYPNIGADLVLGDARIAEYLDLVLGDRIAVTDLPAQHPDAGVDVIAQGFTETITKNRWNLEVNATPAGPWSDMGEVDTARVDSDASTLTSPIDDNDVTLSVTSTAASLWTADDTLDGFTIVIDGEPMTVTDVAGAASPQTFTVVRDTLAPAAHSAGAEVRIDPGAVIAF